MSEHELKRFLGRILGEVYRLQHKAGVPCPVGKGTVYGLLNGIETAIDETLGADHFITKEQHDKLADVMEKHFHDPEKLAAFQGYYDIEEDLRGTGIDRGTALYLLTYWANNGQFEKLIRKMDSSHSPTECRTFELDEFDR